MRRAMISACAFLMLAGCTTAAQREAQHIATVGQTSLAALKACAATAAQGHDDLAIHMPISPGAGRASLSQLASTDKITDSEIKSLLDWHTAIEKCREARLTAAQSVVPTLAIIYQETYDKADDTLLMMMKRQITWGEAVQRMQALSDGERRELEQAWQAKRSELQHADAAERRQRAAAFAAIADGLAAANQAYQNQQLINAINRPRTTNCTGTYYTASCTTY